MSQSFVRVPPQSTGKRVLTTGRYQLGFDNLTGNFNTGQVVTGATSGATGTIASLDTEGFVSAEGVLWLTDVTGTFVNDENLQVGAVTQAVSNITGQLAFEEYDIQNIAIADPDNPSYKQKIDRFGATLNTFTDGSPIFGSFGTLSVGEPQIIRDHRFAYDDHPNDFWDQTNGSGAVSYDSNGGLVLLSTGTGLNDTVIRTDNYYSPYEPGIGHSIEMTVRCGDAGKANNVRRWGYFDSSDGLFFELDGTTLYTVLRSSTSGSVVEQRVEQSNWNKDPLDGSDNINFTLDITNPNIYFIDMQWLGAGRVRFGIVEPGGAKLVAHQVENANSAGDFPYMRTATLPLRYENFNTGSTGGSSELRVACASVKHASSVSRKGDKRGYESGVITVTQAAGEVPVYSIRPKTTFKGRINRAIIKTIAATFTNITNTGGAPVLFRVYAGTDAALTGESFASVNDNSVAEQDTSASSINTSLATKIAQFMVIADQAFYSQVNDDRSLPSYELYLNADGTTQPCFIVTAEVLSGTNADIHIGINAEEVKR